MGDKIKSMSTIQFKYTFNSLWGYIWIALLIGYLISNLILRSFFVQNIPYLERTHEVIQSLYRPTFTFILIPIFLFLKFKRFKVYIALDESIRIRFSKDIFFVLFYTELMFELPFLFYTLLHIFLQMPFSLSEYSFVLLCLSCSKYFIYSMIILVSHLYTKIDLKFIFVFIMFLNLLISNVMVSF